MKGTLHLAIKTISGRTIISDENDIGEETEDDLQEGIVGLAEMIKAPNLTILTVQVDGYSVIVRGTDISSVTIVGSTEELKELIWSLV